MMQYPPLHHSWSFIRLTGCVLSLVSLWVTAPAAAVTPVMLVDTELTSQQVNIHGLSDGTISFFDAERQLRVEPISQYVQLRVVQPIGLTEDTDRITHLEPAEAGTSDELLGVLEVTDGQRLTGRWVGTDESTQQVRWHHPVLGELKVDLDRVAAIWIDHQLPGYEIEPDTDWVELQNGDTMSGFVESVSAVGVMILPDGHDEAFEVLRSQVRSLKLASPSGSRIPEGVMVWLTDGSRVRVGLISIASDRVSVELLLGADRPVVEMPLGNLTRINMTSSEGYLLDLQDLPVTVTGGGVVFGLDTPPKVEGEVLMLHAPVSVRWEPPKGAAWFAATVALNDAPVSSRWAKAWADLEVSVWAGGHLAGRVVLNPEHPVGMLHTPLDGQVITVEVSPAANGPVMDRVVLRDAIVFIRPQQ